MPCPGPSQPRPNLPSQHFASPRCSPQPAPLSAPLLPPWPGTTDNKSTLEVNYLDIANTMPVVAIWLADHPREMLPILGEAAQ